MPIRHDLESYIDLVNRIKSLETENVTDSVSGSSSEWPYTQHSVSIHGFPSQEYQHLSERKQAIDNYIDSISDLRARNLIDLHYRKGHSWAKIASLTGRSIGANENFLQRFFKCV